ncbi:hypothetical protein C474_09387 [Halogeometricum pallidum JCM 14848]|uniref:Uncharacterized protein n=1 Tax=Halogeometricum pallidum JCM 14848 TaxID=1227487 RepID=M0D9N6_HALPD|nr:hypothetical protein [Halogeometricum pallidum]ELZ31503.1 hypothetical protein C474_09387 [Halogeometricum pallidum JCM 14848]
MTSSPTDERRDADGITSVASLDALRDRGVPFFEESETVNAETFDRFAELDDLAPTGVVDDAGRVLLARVTEDCPWKIPSPAVAEREDYATAARRWIREQTCVAVTIDGVEGVWSVTVRAEGEAREATRRFVVFAATPKPAPDSAAGDVGDGDAAAVAWADELPDGAERPPGTDRFFD